MNRDKPLLQVCNLTKTYFMDGVSVKALRGVNLSFYQGEFTSIMGASGSGKSTMMHIMGCLDRPTSGQYFIDGEDVSSFSKDQLAMVRNRRIGFVFQGFNLLSRTSALENVELPMIYAGIPSEERRERAMAALASVGLKGREHHHPNQLSGGQQQRVAIARALVNRPSVILADEPTGNLDSYSSVEIMGIFQDLNANGISIVLITHEPDIAMYTSRVVRLSDGQVISDEPVSARLLASEEIKKHRRPGGSDDEQEEQA
ncbi:MAG TPA: ABC transporter ATP-binding protein [Candidatus Rifleibacterium sp.]|nr:ABC transporter ATP-binding protein [Candidatus Rifleibacterium sp.]